MSRTVSNSSKLLVFPPPITAQPRTVTTSPPEKFEQVVAYYRRIGSAVPRSIGQRSVLKLLGAT